MRREDGQTMAEYGVTLTTITIGVVAAFTFLSSQIIVALERVGGLLP